MNRTVLTAVALIFVISGAFALSLQVQTIPGVVTPGTSGKIIFHITATTGAKNIEMRVGPVDAFDIEDEDTRIDVGDAMGGTVSYALGFSVPETIKPGVYVIPVKIEYEDTTTGTTYEEHFAPTITVTSGKGISVKMATDRVYGNREMTARFTVSNSGEPIYNAKMVVPVAIGDPTAYIGDLRSGESKDIYVTILPECMGGIYAIPIIITGYRGSTPFSEEINYMVKCIPPKDDLRVEMEIPQSVAGGEQNTTLTITNLTSVSVGPVSVNITGMNVKIGGQTSYYINALPPQGHVSIPVIWKLEKADEQGSIQVIIATPSGQRTYSYAVMPSAKPDLRVYPSSVKWVGDKIDVSLTVANVGTSTAETVFVSAEGNAEGQTVIGDLSPGDYDSADIYIRPTGKTAQFGVEVSYIVDGQKKTIKKTITVGVPEQPKNYGIWILLAVVVAGAIWWWRTKR